MMVILMITMWRFVSKLKLLTGMGDALTGIIPVPEYKDPEHKKGRTGVTEAAPVARTNEQLVSDRNLE